MTTGRPAKGYKLTASRIAILRALAIHGPFADSQGQCVRQLMGHTGHRSTQSLSTALEGLEAVGLVGRETRNQRTYRIEVVLDALTPEDRAALELPAPPPTASASPAQRMPGSVYLTKTRVEVLRALLADGPIHDPGGHATRILMQRLGRIDFANIHGLLTGMARLSLIRRTVRQGRVVALEATIDGLSPTDRQRIWSKADFPIDTQPVIPATVEEPTDHGPISVELEAHMVVEALQAELEAIRSELARTRIQLEMFRAWAHRMPTFDTGPAQGLAPAGSEPATVINAAAMEPAPADRVEYRAVEGGGGHQALLRESSSALCLYVYPDHDLERHGEPCGRRTWEGSTEWCWGHDPTPAVRRKAFPVRRVTTNPDAPVSVVPPLAG